MSQQVEPRRAATIASASQDLAVSVSELVKSYGTRRAVDGLSFSIARGEVFALLGPNGAGKTTTVEILEGYRRADSGQVRVLGLDPAREPQQLKSRLGVMLQQDGLQSALTALEVLQLYAGFFASPLEPRTLLERVGLSDSARTRCRRLSGGQKRRLALAVALIGRPEVLFLDEPTTGMDPQARLATWEIVRELRSEGVTVLLTTHLMDEAERLADRVAIIDRGRLVALDTPAALRGAGDNRTVRLVAPAALATQAWLTLPGVQSVEETAPGVYTLHGEEIPLLIASVTNWLSEKQLTLTSLQVGYGSLEDVYLSLTGKEERP